MIEANYELEHDYSGPTTLRRQEFWSILSGATGQFYGNRYTWSFTSGWKDHLDTVGSLQMGSLANFFQSRRWFDLVPDQQHTFLTNGYGGPAADGSVNDSDYATAAVTDDRSLAIVYIPSERTVTLNLAEMRGPARARWYDPSDDSYQSIGDGTLANLGVIDFRTPGDNAGGDSDWVLVLELAE